MDDVSARVRWEGSPVEWVEGDYVRYLAGALEARAPEGDDAGLLDCVARRAVRWAGDATLAGGLAEARRLEEAWAGAEVDARGEVDGRVLRRASRTGSDWALPAARAAAVTAERLGIYALWTSTWRVALLRRRSAAPAAVEGAAYALLRGTVARPAARWHVRTHPSGARSGGRFLLDALDGRPVEGGVRRPREETLGWEGDTLDEDGAEWADPVAALAFPEPPLVAALLTCAHHRRVLASPGGAERLLTLVLASRCPELAAAGREHRDEELATSVRRVLALWDRVCASVEGPLRRAMGSTLPRGMELGDGERLQPALDRVRAWFVGDLRPRLGEACAALPPGAGELAARFFVEGASLRTVGRALDSEVGSEVDAAWRFLAHQLPVLLPALDQAYVAARRFPPPVESGARR